jgi:hypothetical protein
VRVALRLALIINSKNIRAIIYICIRKLSSNNKQLDILGDVRDHLSDSSKLEANWEKSHHNSKDAIIIITTHKSANRLLKAER